VHRCVLAHKGFEYSFPTLVRYWL